MLDFDLECFDRTLLKELNLPTELRILLLIRYLNNQDPDMK